MKYRKTKRFSGASPYAADAATTAASKSPRDSDYDALIMAGRRTRARDAPPSAASSSGFCASSSSACASGSPPSCASVSPPFGATPVVSAARRQINDVQPKSAATHLEHQLSHGYRNTSPHSTQINHRILENKDVHELTRPCTSHDDDTRIHVDCALDEEDYGNDSAALSPQLHDFSCATPARKNLIEKLIEIDRLEALINLRGLKLRNAAQTAAETAGAAQRLSHIGDEIVEQLVEWTKTLPFYAELPVEVHTHLLTQRWAELVLLSACFYAYCTNGNAQPLADDEKMMSSRSITHATQCNLYALQARLSAIMGKHIPIEHVNKEAGPLVETFTQLYESFCRLRITLEAYVCLKVITILHYAAPVYENEEENRKSAKIHALYARRVYTIQDQFVKALQIHLSQCEDGPRLSEILNWQPALSLAGTALLQSKMFYVPFLICKMPDALPSAATITDVAAVSTVENASYNEIDNDETDDDEN